MTSTPLTSFFRIRKQSFWSFNVNPDWTDGQKVWVKPDGGRGAPAQFAARDRLQGEGGERGGGADVGQPELHPQPGAPAGHVRVGVPAACGERRLGRVDGHSGLWVQHVLWLPVVQGSGRNRGGAGARQRHHVPLQGPEQAPPHQLQPRWRRPTTTRRRPRCRRRRATRRRARPPRRAKPAGFAAAAGHEQATLSWSTSDRTITKHQYRRKAGGAAWGAWTDIADSAPGGAHAASYTVAGLSNGVSPRLRAARGERRGRRPGVGPGDGDAGPAAGAGEARGLHGGRRGTPGSRSTGSTRATPSPGTRSSTRATPPSPGTSTGARRATRPGAPGRTSRTARRTECTRCRTR